LVFHPSLQRTDTLGAIELLVKADYSPSFTK
jgi:hypothetical protein